MKHVKLFLFGLWAALLLLACSSHAPYDPKDQYGSNMTNLYPQVAHLDTITPPINPLHPLSTEVQALPCFYGYLNIARYLDDKRYCALIGMVEKEDYVYFLTDSAGQLFRYDSPIVADCRVGELLYVRGILTQEAVQNKFVLKLQVADIERTDSIVPYETIIHH